MTDFTDELRKGELKLGEHYYYTTIFSPTVHIQNFTRDVISFQDFKETVAEVLDKVPSYEEWQAKLEQNTKLKELLKRAKGLMNCTKDWACTDATEEIIDKINQVLGEE